MVRIEWWRCAVGDVVTSPAAWGAAAAGGTTSAANSSAPLYKELPSWVQKAAN
jgi:hypothetical protein